MGCQGRRGSLARALCAMLVGALAWVSPAAANSIVVDDVSIGESGSATFTITRHADLLAGSTTVAFQTIDGSAGAADYSGRAGALAFGSAVLGATQTWQVVVAIDDDALDELT